MLTLDLLQAIDERIRKGEQNIVAFGTVTTVLSDTNIMVTFDGSFAAVPCKLFGNTEAAEGDRVGLIKIAPWWVAFGSFARRWPGEGGAQQFQGTPGSTTSSTYADLPTPVSFTYNKKYDLTRTRMNISASAWVSSGTGNGGADWGMRFVSTEFGEWTHSVVAFYHNSAGGDINFGYSGTQYTPGAVTWGSGNLPAGLYNVSVQWRRYSGTGTLNVNGENRVSGNAMEVEP